MDTVLVKLNTNLAAGVTHNLYTSPRSDIPIRTPSLRFIPQSNSHSGTSSLSKLPPSATITRQERCQSLIDIWGNEHNEKRAPVEIVELIYAWPRHTDVRS